MAPVQRKILPARPGLRSDGSKWAFLALGMLTMSGCGRDYDAILALEPRLERGQILYNSNCAGCHAKDGTGISGPSLFERLPTLTGPEILQTIEEGVGDMPAFEGQFDDQELRDIHGWITIEFQD